MMVHGANRKNQFRYAISYETEGERRVYEETTNGSKALLAAQQMSKGGYHKVWIEVEYKGD